LFSLFFCLLSATQAYAQSAAQTKLIQQAKSDADGQERAASVAAVELEYKSCPKGHYGGPRPHRVRFTRDLWIWVVTPEFAKQYCMPKEFVSEELKGAEAIAFKMYGEPDQSSCGFGGKSEVCDGGSKELRFEIYVKSDTKLPKIRNVPYYMPPTLPSKFLITPSQQNLKESDENHKNGGGMPGTQHIFDGQQVALTGIKDGKSVWFVVTLYNQGFYSNVLGGIDFLSFHGSAGHIKDRRIDAKGIKNFAITFDPLMINHGRKSRET
jgi:hypothetical protein